MKIRITIESLEELKGLLALARGEDDEKTRMLAVRLDEATAGLDAAVQKEKADDEHP